MKISLPDTQPILVVADEHLFVALSPRWLNFVEQQPDPVLTEWLWPMAGEELIAMGSEMERGDNPPSSMG